MNSTTSISKEELLNKIESAKKALEDVPHYNRRYLIDDVLLDKLFDLAYNSIPIGWIKKYIENHTYEMVNPKYVDDTYNYIQFTEKPLDYNLIVMPIQVKAMLEEWEKENG